MPTRYQSLTTAEYQALVTGLPKFCPNLVLTIGGQSYTVPQLVALVSSVVAADLAVPVSKAAWLAAVKTIEELEVTDGTTIKEARSVVALMFKNDPITLAELAIEPKPARKPLSSEARLVATAKLRATREARGTTSKKQKARIKGNVSGVTITPILTGAAELAPSTPEHE